MAEEERSEVESEKKERATVVKKKRKGVFSRIWNSIFRLQGDDFEKRLENISKEEAAVLARMKRRSLTWRKITRRLIVFSVIFEAIAVGYAIMTTRSMDLDWKMRAFHVLPMFLLPFLSCLAYTAFVNFIRMRNRKDQKTLERLRAERQAKIDELKERTNYYITQQLIQRYDTDPAAKAAAATVLASKLGADSGLKVYLGDESNPSISTGKSNDAEVVRSGELRNRKQVDTTKSRSTGSSPVRNSDEGTLQSQAPETLEHNQLVVEHYDPTAATSQEGGWIAKIAALLVGEDPTQSYALICGNCHMHNGLARKEDFPYITYYCPHCRALNKPKGSEERVSGMNSPHLDIVEASNSKISSGNDSTLTSSSPVKAGSEIEEVDEKVAHQR